MLVKEWMSKPVILINHDQSLNEAAKKFKTRVISMLPVLKDGILAGVVTDGDIKKAMPSEATSLDKFEIPALLDSVSVETVMSSPVITIQCDHTIDEAAGMMLKKGISGMPVVTRKGHIEGIITKSDIFRCFVSFTGVSNKGQIFAFTLQDKPGLIKNLTEIIRSSGGRLCSVMTSYDDIEDGYRKVFFHTFDIEPQQFDAVVEKLHVSGDLYYAADLSRGLRRLINR